MCGSGSGSLVNFQLRFWLGLHSSAGWTGAGEATLSWFMCFLAKEFSSLPWGLLHRTVHDTAAGFFRLGYLVRGLGCEERDMERERTCKTERERV